MSTVAAIVFIGLLVALIGTLTWTIDGPSGSEGSLGKRGIRGLRGAQPFSPSSGPQGPPGVAGELGPVGYPGLRGLSGPPAAYGPSGLLTMVGPSAPAEAVSTYNNSEWTVQLDVPQRWPLFVTSTGNTIGGPSVNITVAAGPSGATALTFDMPLGPTGASGTQGSQGPSTSGPQGLTGWIGSANVSGPQGFQGFLGVQGPVSRALSWTINTSVDQTLQTGGPSDQALWDPLISVVPAGQMDQLGPGPTYYYWTVPFTGLWCISGSLVTRATRAGDPVGACSLILEGVLAPTYANILFQSDVIHEDPVTSAALTTTKSVYYVLPNVPAGSRWTLFVTIPTSGNEVPVELALGSQLVFTYLGPTIAA